MIKRKDNLTDIVEDLQKDRDKKPEPNQKPEKPGKNEWQVTDNEGNIVTLGQKPGSRTASSNKANPVELSQDVMEAIKQAVQTGIKEAFEKWEEKRRREKS